MNRLVIIGNGFDLAHGLKTSYQDFFYWLWEDLVEGCSDNQTNKIESPLCTITLLKESVYNTWSSIYCNLWHYIKPEGKELYRCFSEEKEKFSLENKILLSSICESVEDKGWVDVENEYYTLLKGLLKKETRFHDHGYTIDELNEQLSFLKTKLVKYLSLMGSAVADNQLYELIINPFDLKDFSVEGNGRACYDINSRNVEKAMRLIPERIMLLSFNYTHTVQNYGNFNVTINYIHGELAEPSKIIFGYGDELDKDFQEIVDELDNRLLDNNKSVRYLETNHYRAMLEFISSSPFQVFIMGHSCGNSDRTLLNTIFEHANCLSIKPFYYKKENGADNYIELVQNVSRNFTDMKLFRDRVVNKEHCLPMCVGISRS